MSTHANPGAGGPAAGAPGTTRSSAVETIAEAARPAPLRVRWLLIYFALGIVFGLALTKGEVISWFRIQEMFRLQGFYLYGVFMTALAVAIPTLALVKRAGLRSLETGEPVVVPPKQLGRGYRYWIGGGLFGAGLALTGACPGPMFALIGAGVPVIVVPIASAVAGVWAYGHLRPRLPH